MKLSLVTLLLFSLSLPGCADSPSDRYQAAYEAGQLAKKKQKNKKQSADTMERYLLFFTQSSAEFLRTADQLVLASSKSTYVNVRTLLPKAEAKDVNINGNMATLTMKSKKSEFEVRMLQEKGNWVIDPFSMKLFWAPLNKEANDD
jgi:hypothetical protein